MSTIDNNFATHYRPTTFSEVVGQEIPKLVLKKIAKADGIACRSIFIKGSYGSGKSTLARIFAKAFVCSKFKQTGEVCNTCDECKEAMAKNSQTYFEFDASVVGNVEAIRSLHDKLSYLPPRNLRRVVVFDEVHAASNAALNALLKIVEEGMPNTIFVFCSTEDILPTLKSRSVCLEVTTVPHNLMSERLKTVAALEHLQITDDIIDAICNKSQGHMRDALSILQLYSLAGEEAVKTPLALFNKFVISVLQKKKDLANVLLSDILLYPTTDIAQTVATFIKNIYTSSEDSKLHVLLQKGFAPKLFSFFYNPVAQQALKSEAGTEILLRSFLEKAS